MPAEARAYPRPLPNPEWLGKLTKRPEHGASASEKTDLFAGTASGFYRLST